MITINLDLKFEKTKDNYDILKISKDNKWIYIGSKYNMKLEIDKFLDKIGEENDEKRVFLIYGFATGEHIRALRNKFNKNKIVVFEPNTRIKDYIDNLKWVEEDKNLHILYSRKDDLINNLKEYIEEFNMNHTKFIYFSNYDNIYRNELKKFLGLLKDYFVTMRIETNTKIVFSRRWFQTLMKNIPYIVCGTPANLYENKYRNKPAIIVSAGPSLEKNIDELKNLDNEMFVISGGRTLRSLIDKKINPHLLAVVDPGDISYELVEGYIENSNIPLLFYEGTNEKVVSNHKGEKIFFSSNTFTYKLAEKEVSSFSVGGSVAHSMARCAVFLGCNPIIFIGQDLAYTNDSRYSSITENRDGGKKFEEIKSENDIWVEDINGNKVKTNLELNSFRLDFEKMIKKFPDIKFINATEGGARIHGTIEIPLYEVIKQYKVKGIEPIKRIEYPVDMKKNAINVLEEAKKSSKFIIGKSKKSLRYLDELKTAYIMKKDNLINSILKELDKLDEKIKDKYENVELIGNLLYPIIYETLTAKSINSNKPDLDEMKSIIERNKKLYRNILNELEYAMDYIEETILKLQENE